jgi:hypothetical protein
MNYITFSSLVTVSLLLVGYSEIKLDMNSSVNILIGLLFYKSNNLIKLSTEKIFRFFSFDIFDMQLFFFRKCERIKCQTSIQTASYLHRETSAR